jgi:hypothetical protein
MMSLLVVDFLLPLGYDRIGVSQDTDPRCSHNLSDSGVLLSKSVLHRCMHIDPGDQDIYRILPCTFPFLSVYVVRNEA